MLSTSQHQQLKEWLAETGELFAEFRRPVPEGRRKGYFIRSIAELDKLLQSDTRPDLIVTIFHRKQYPLRGVANFDLLTLALQQIPNGQWFSILSWTDRPAAPCTFLTRGSTHSELRRMLGEFTRSQVAVGPDPFDNDNGWINSAPSEVMVLRKSLKTAVPEASAYSAFDLMGLLLAQKGEYIRLEPDSPPYFLIKGVPHEVEGPGISEGNITDIVRELADTRQLRAFRKTQNVEFNYVFKRTLFLVRAVHAFGFCRLDLHIVEKMLKQKAQSQKPPPLE